MAEKPKVYLVLKILGPCLMALGIVSIILGVVVFPEPFGFDGGTVINFAFLVPGVFLIFGGVFMLLMGFTPEMQKNSIKTARYLQEETKEDLTQIADNSADILDGAVKKTVRAVKEGLKDTKFCKHCGAKIDADSKFCSECGKEQ